MKTTLLDGFSFYSKYNLLLCVPTFNFKYASAYFTHCLYIYTQIEL